MQLLDSGRAVVRPLTRRYVLALTLIALLSVGSHLALQRVVRTHAGAGAEINVSGRQRMLSQRIALLAALLTRAEDPRERAALRAELGALADEMERAHTGLLRDGPTRELGAADQPVRDYLREVRALLATPDARLEPPEPPGSVLRTSARDNPLTALDAVALGYQHRSEAQVAALEHAQQGVLATTLVVLLLEGLLVFRPLSRRLAARTEEAVQAEAWLRSVVDNVLVGMLTVDAGGRITSCNLTGGRLFGYEPEVAVGLPLTALAAGDEDARTLDDARSRALDGGQVAPVEFQARRQDGTSFPAEVAASLASGTHPTVSILLADVTERRALEEALTHRAFHDALTGLPNRALFMDRLDSALSRRHPPNLAVLFVDVDDFKTVNDGLGHAAGDHLLVAVANRLRGCLRGSDTAARLGGDEFAVLLDGFADAAQVELVAGRILDALRLPLAVQDHALAISASIGVALHREGDEPVGGEALLRDADVAMYRAKSRGKARAETFVPALQERAP